MWCSDFIIKGDWSVRFDYTIGIGQEVERFPDGFLLPGEERPLARTIRGAPAGTAVFNIDAVSWRRVSRREIPDFAVWRNEHLNFEVTNAEFLPAIIQGKGSVSRARFTIANQTAYGYVAPKFLVLLYRGTRLAGIQSTILDQFKSGETRAVEVSWIDGLGAVSNIEVIPEIDILNPEVYLK